ncbi:AAA family ATPase [Aliivibrio fischeri]|uniref:AAA family ATPase n=1 Tax=Aliivibrio fischeri TaxID=668 RepID=UPI0007C4AAEB|nr:hypothetical protein [Aliivibrio fischeri]
MKVDLFPRRVVVGEGFCNRVKERAKLAALLSQGTHVWIQAHRRHGKTSLLEQVGEDMRKSGENIAQARCHLLFNSGNDNVIKQLTKTTAQLMGQVAQINAKANGHTKADSIFDYIKKEFSKRTLNVKLDRGIPSITFDEHEAGNNLDTLRDALAQLEEYALKADVRVLFILDEYQEVGKTSGGIETESALRHQLEQSKAIVFVFCGSERSLMEQSLNDKKRPLYNHTKPFALRRIEGKHYKKHFNQLAMNKWGSPLTDDVVEAILRYSECHPYYVNSICSDLWLLPELPVIEDVDDTWNEVINLSEREEKGLILSLSTNEKKVLSGISRGITTKLLSMSAASEMGLAIGSIQRSLQSLLNKDIIEQDNNQYYVINPVISAIARRNA